MSRPFHAKGVVCAKGHRRLRGMSVHCSQAIFNKVIQMNLARWEVLDHGRYCGLCLGIWTLSQSRKDSKLTYDMVVFEKACFILEMRANCYPCYLPVRFSVPVQKTTL